MINNTKKEMQAINCKHLPCKPHEHYVLKLYTFVYYVCNLMTSNDTCRHGFGDRLPHIISLL